MTALKPCSASLPNAAAVGCPEVTSCGEMTTTFGASMLAGCADAGVCAPDNEDRAASAETANSCQARNTAMTVTKACEAPSWVRPAPVPVLECAARDRPAQSRDLSRS